MRDQAVFNPRRRLLLQAGLGLLGAGVLRPVWGRDRAEASISRAIPSSGQRIPIIGMGTWQTFNVGNDAELIRDRAELLRTFLELGGGMVDSSPMYGSSEAVLGRCLDQIGRPQPKLFAATKVWTGSADEGREQIGDSRRLWGLARFDLFQVHNLLAWEEHLPRLLAMKQAGQLGYVGITTSHGRRHADLERLMLTQPLDFVQLTYNILDREPEQRLLPIARERGIAIIVNRPFRRKALIRQFQGQPLPSWAGEIGARSWAQFLLKFAVSHPAVTCAIPATTRVDHLRENMAVGRGDLPDQKTRQAMVEYVAGL